MKSPHTDFGTYTGGRDDLLNLWSYIAVGASAIRSSAFTAIYSLPFCSLPGLLAFFLLLLLLFGLCTSSGLGRRSRTNNTGCSRWQTICISAQGV